MELTRLTALLHDDTTYINRDDLVHALDVAWHHRMVLANHTADECHRECFMHEAQVLAAVLQVLRAAEPRPNTIDFAVAVEALIKRDIMDELIAIAREHMIFAFDAGAYHEEMHEKMAKLWGKTKRKTLRRTWNRLLKEYDDTDAK